MEQQALWEKCVAFHGHACGGLTIGFQAARYAMELLELDFSADEDVVCIAENDAWCYGCNRKRKYYDRNGNWDRRKRNGKWGDTG